MNGLLLSPTTRKDLTDMLEGDTHAVILVGQAGSGKNYLARYYIAERMKLETPDKLTNHPQFMQIVPKNGNIGIEEVRTLHQFLRLKTLGGGTIKRAILIEYADTMTTEAQNALLKVLEEPPADTLLVLTANDYRGLRPTIISRVQKLNVLPVSEQESQDYFLSGSYTSSEVTVAYRLSGGNVGLLVALLDKTEDHTMLESVKQAKALIGMSQFERLVQVDSLAKQKELLPELLRACKLVCQGALNQTRQDYAKTKRWHHALKQILKAESALEYSANTKLVLTNLFVNL